MQHRSAQRGFTLVELSIVLVILGLLVGGVLSGQSLIRAAELRAVATERDRTVTALYAFRDKYLALPGDMPNAADFWPDCGAATTDAGTGCNGNGDGRIQFGGGENVRAWRHLSFAGLIEGTYTGNGTVTSTAGGDAVGLSARNSPASRLAQSHWNIGNQPCHHCGAGTPDLSDLGTGGYLLLALGTLPDDDSNFELLRNATLTNGEVWNLDTKLDDGRSRTGTMRGNASNRCDDAGTDYYELQAEGADTKGNCNPLFVLN